MSFEWKITNSNTVFITALIKNNQYMGKKLWNHVKNNKIYVIICIGVLLSFQSVNWKVYSLKYLNVCFIVKSFGRLQLHHYPQKWFFIRRGGFIRPPVTSTCFGGFVVILGVPLWDSFVSHHLQQQSHTQIAVVMLFSTKLVFFVSVRKKKQSFVSRGP